MTRPTVAVTGLGAVSPLGLRVAEMWAGLSRGASGISEIRTFDAAQSPCRFAGQAPEYKIQQHVPKSHRKATKLMSRDIELAVIATAEAIGQSGVITKGIDPDNTNVDPARIGVNLGAGLITCDLPEIAPSVASSWTDDGFDMRQWGREGMEHITPLWLLKYLPNMLACHISIIHDIQGPSNTVTCAETSAHLAIAEAAQTIARGDCDIAVAGGAESKTHPIIILRQYFIGRASTIRDVPPESACRPFDAQAAGSIFGEGAGIVVLEDLACAKARGANVLAEIAGVGHSSSTTAPCGHIDPDGASIRLAVERALEDAEITPEQLDLVIPHGTAIPADDLAEAKGLEAALGPATASTPVWPTKSMLSNTGAASGALDIIAGICAMTGGAVPSARNFASAMPGCNLKIARQAQQTDIRYLLSCSYTHGGQTAAVVLKKAEAQ